MNLQDQAKLELLIANMEDIKEEFRWQNVNTSRLAALLYTLEDKHAPAAAIRASYTILKENTSQLSMFRNMTAIIISSLLSLHEDPEIQMEQTLSVYDSLKKSGFKASMYLTIAAYEIAANAPQDQHLHMIERTQLFYKGMKQHHRFLTNQDDYIFAAMLALSDIEPAAGVERMEQLHTALQSEFRNNNSLQTLTQVLVLGGETSHTLDRLLLLRETLNKQGLPMDKLYTLSSLGVLSLLAVAPETIASDISGAYEYLRTQKGFNRWSMNKEQRLLYAAAIVSARYINEAQKNVLTPNIATNITNLIIAQQTATITAVTAAAAASAAASG